MCPYPISYKRKSSKKKKRFKNALKATYKSIKSRIIKMILKEFGSGWQERFESRLQDLLTIFPNIELITVERFHGMLRVEFNVPDQRTDYIIKAVTYKIERESAVCCEKCGGSGRRKEEYLPEKLCLCWKCYAIEIDKILNP